jgi:NADPH-dependent 2,4-dienoyl-CoA reductase/sulfur reductase-like enzyme
LEVTVVEPEPVPVRRPFGDRMGALVADLHRDHGTRLRCGTPVCRLRGAGGRVTGVELGDGTTLSAEVVVLALGSTPATHWLAGSSLRLRDGVECDALCRAAPGIYAAGDVASWHNPHFGTRMRLEHRMNATEQAMAPAGNLRPGRRLLRRRLRPPREGGRRSRLEHPPPGTHAASPGRRTRVVDSLHGRTRAPPGNRELTPSRGTVTSG